jgi:hypothetical protein
MDRYDDVRQQVRAVEFPLILTASVVAHRCGTAIEAVPQLFVQDVLAAVGLGA